jgi:hypothetical protein
MNHLSWITVLLPLGALAAACGSDVPEVGEKELVEFRLEKFFPKEPAPDVARLRMMVEGAKEIAVDHPRPGRIDFGEQRAPEEGIWRVHGTFVVPLRISVPATPDDFLYVEVASALDTSKGAANLRLGNRRDGTVTPFGTAGDVKAAFVDRAALANVVVVGLESDGKQVGFLDFIYPWAEVTGVSSGKWREVDGHIEMAFDVRYGDYELELTNASGDWLIASCKGPGIPE